MKIKFISLAVLSLGICTLAISAEYKSPKVAFKKATPSHQETKMAEFSEEYKMEGAVKADRQIASEEDHDREPSSVVGHDKKQHEEVDEKASEEFEPKPWLYRTNKDKNF